MPKEYILPDLHWAERILGISVLRLLLDLPKYYGNHQELDFPVVGT